jgi:hypothetical protein
MIHENQSVLIRNLQSIGLRTQISSPRIWIQICGLLAFELHCYHKDIFLLMAKVLNRARKTENQHSINSDRNRSRGRDWTLEEQEQLKR